jgi:hypothetical protein
MVRSSPTKASDLQHAEKFCYKELSLWRLFSFEEHVFSVRVRLFCKYITNHYVSRRRPGKLMISKSVIFLFISELRHVTHVASL